MLESHLIAMTSKFSPPNLLQDERAKFSANGSEAKSRFSSYPFNHFRGVD